MAPTQLKEQGKKEINIVVTGFAPWPPHPINPAWQVANALPRVIFGTGAAANIRLTLYPDAVPVSWSAVRSLVPELWKGERELYRLYSPPTEPATFEIDAVIHLGLNSLSRNHFSLERTGYGDGYEAPDVDGKRPDAEDKSGGGEWEGLPDVLTTRFDLVAARESIAGSVKHAEVIVSDDPGRYLCCYIYYASLALLHKQGKPKNVVFLHLPNDSSNEAIEQGVQVATALAEAIANDIAKANR